MGDLACDQTTSALGEANDARVGVACCVRHRPAQHCRLQRGDISLRCLDASSKGCSLVVQTLHPNICSWLTGCRRYAPRPESLLQHVLRTGRLVDRAFQGFRLELVISHRQAEASSYHRDDRPRPSANAMSHVLHARLEHTLGGMLSTAEYWWGCGCLLLSDRPPLTGTPPHMPVSDAQSTFFCSCTQNKTHRVRNPLREIIF